MKYCGYTPGIMIDIHNTIQISNGQKHQIGFHIRDQLMMVSEYPSGPYNP